MKSEALCVTALQDKKEMGDPKAYNPSTMTTTLPDDHEDGEHGGSVYAEWWERCTQSGPRMKWSEVMQSRHCQTEEMCAVFKDRHPSTVAMTVLVVVEMFNALNALSENNSLLQARGCPLLAARC